MNRAPQTIGFFSAPVNARRRPAAAEAFRAHAKPPGNRRRGLNACGSPKLDSAPSRAAVLSSLCRPALPGPEPTRASHATRPFRDRPERPGRARPRLGHARLPGLQHRQPRRRRDRGSAILADDVRAARRRPGARPGAPAAREDRHGRPRRRHQLPELRRARFDAHQGRGRRRCRPHRGQGTRARSSAAGSSMWRPTA